MACPYKLLFRRAAVVAHSTAFPFGGKDFLGGGNGLRQTSQRVVLAEDAYHRPPSPPFSHKSGGYTLFLGNDEPPFSQEIHLEANGLMFFIGEFRVIPVGKSQIVKRLVVGVYPVIPPAKPGA